MGVPALFRWLSKKYPKIVQPVLEEEPAKMSGEDGEEIEVPIDITTPNPNGIEFDNLYLDFNGIVHPCTHPEGRPAPESEEEMMLEIFKYTERVVDMIRPRRLLFIAIDGVAPRAKMNQQRSRRFRAAQEAEEKEQARQEGIALFESLGKTVEDSKEAWDSNAITPGTPFMDLLSTSVKYWITKKLNTDPGWKKLQVIFSDGSVPGEGEHKIMDWIRRQRSNPSHDPNTSHVIYGLDADLIMLSLATHEPNFRVLREDVFFQETTRGVCRICGQEGHYAAQCTGEKSAEPKAAAPATKKPFIFLDVPVLREYLEIELNMPHLPFAFNLEQAIDDWVLLIFFVGNDFLPHLPSLEIREGAIDTLLKIWKEELPRMGGYLTNNGHLELARIEVMFQALAQREDEIFKRRREVEERRDQNAKRRKVESDASLTGPTAVVNGTDYVAVPYTPQKTNSNGAGNSNVATPTSLPPRPPFNTVPQGEAAAPTHFEQGVRALGGSNHDVVANRHAIRLANMSAADILRAELAGNGGGGGQPELFTPGQMAAQSKKPTPAPPPMPELFTPGAFAAQVNKTPGPAPAPVPAQLDMGIPGLGGAAVRSPTAPLSPNKPIAPAAGAMDPGPAPATNGPVPGASASAGADPAEPDAQAQAAEAEADADMVVDAVGEAPQGVKRKLEAVEDEDADAVGEDEDPEDPAPITAIARKVLPDGTVEQEDTVRLWEPGYKDRYYQQKFGIAHDDAEHRRKITQSYIEGLAWVLHYYYQGTPSWKWYYPYHFAPFAGDFDDVKSMKVHFELGMPFKAFEQLMGVFPARSRTHIPKPFHPLMLEPDSPIIDFYPTEFEIDMNGKKMAWQGVALLPFIDEKRLLDAMAPHYPKIDEAEILRNKWGPNVLFCGEEHKLFDSFCLLYTKRKKQEPLVIDTKLSGGISGAVLADPSCIPGSTYAAPFEIGGLTDIIDNRAISVLYYYPKQLVPHRSAMLPGVRRPPRVLGPADIEHVRRGGRGGGRDSGRQTPMSSYSPIGGYNQHGQDRGGRYGSNDDWQRGPPHGRGGGYSRGGYNGPARQPPGYGGGYGGGPGYNQYGGPPQGSYGGPYGGYGGGNGGGGYGGGGGGGYGGGGGGYGGGGSGGGYGGYGNSMYPGAGQYGNSNPQRGRGRGRQQ